MEKIKKSFLFFALCIIVVDIIGGISYGFYLGMYKAAALHIAMAVAITPMVVNYFNTLKP